MRPWVYALLCVVVPAVWGALAAWAFGAWERRRRVNELRAGPPPIDYSI